jgi:hypothetical protein
MGVYLPRLNSPDFTKKTICEDEVPHLIFLSRITSWKGFEKFNKITQHFAKDKLHTLAITASNYDTEIFNPGEFVANNSHINFNLSIVSLKLTPGSIHLYPSDYGTTVNYPQSIGMNVLEMISLGIPSLISSEGFESWPEFKGSVLVRVVDWSNDLEIKQVVQ